MTLTVTLPDTTIEWAEREIAFVNAGKDEADRPLGLDDLIHAALIHAMGTRCHCGRAFELPDGLSEWDRRFLRGWFR